MERSTRYIIGIDLGTSHCSVYYVDLHLQSQAYIRRFLIPQIVDRAEVQEKTFLPSCCYLYAPQEFSQKELQLPWKENRHYFVGSYARLCGQSIPNRFVDSVKSWLCHRLVDQRQAFLPIDSQDSNQKISPLDACSAYLAHIRQSWDHTMARNDPLSSFSNQEIVITVPASFDELARKLTVDAASKAAYGNVTLIEEPQAAFYSWLSSHEEDWKSFFSPGDSVLVCDVGGGTTDFSLIDLVENKGTLCFQRSQVGRHLLLGGDNTDLALLAFVEKKVEKSHGKKLGRDQWMRFRQTLRALKEEFLCDATLEKKHVIVEGEGSSFVGGSVSISISRQELYQVLLEGFFPVQDYQEAKVLRKKTGMRFLGLPYEAETSITKHLACFLEQSAKGSFPKCPNYILFNGGVMQAKIFQERVLESLERWFSKKIKILESKDLSVAVSRGAAYFGKSRNGLGVRILGGVPRCYYLEVQCTDDQGKKIYKAFTLFAKGTQYGSRYGVDRAFFLTSNQQVQFSLLSSQVRLDDQAGDLVEINQEEFQRFPPLVSVLKYGKKDQSRVLDVKLSIELTELGTLKIWLCSSDGSHKWDLEFQLQTMKGQEDDLIHKKSRIEDKIWDKKELIPAYEAIEKAFTQKELSLINTLPSQLETCLSQKKENWSPMLLRYLWDSLKKAYQGKKMSIDARKRWWNLAGFFLRPGFSYPLDDLRMKHFWQYFLQEGKLLQQAKDLQLHKWICLRRLSGGLSKGQQMQIISPVVSNFLDKKDRWIETKKLSSYAYYEMLRCAASLEYIDPQVKEKMGLAFLRRIEGGSSQYWDYWSLGRIGARNMLYANYTDVLSPPICQKWIEKLLKLPLKDENAMAHLLLQLARTSGHRHLDIDGACLNKVESYFAKYLPQGQDLCALLHQEISFGGSSIQEIYGDSLPPGLILKSAAV